MHTTKKIIHHIELSQIGLGAMPLSIVGRPSESQARAIIKKYIELGGNFIDTANVYGLDEFDAGHNERLISSTLSALGCLDKVLIATKGGATRPQGGWSFNGGHPIQLRAAVDASLKNLKLSALPLYYLHGRDPNVAFEDSLAELVRLKRDGKILHIGIANVTLADLHLAMQMTPIAAVQNRCNTFCKEDFKNGLIEFCKQNNILYVAYCPLGGWYDHFKLSRVKLYHHFIEKYKVSSYLISLSWLLSKQDQIIPIPGMDKINQVTSNLQSTVQLDEEDINIIDQFPDLYSASHNDNNLLTNQQLNALIN